MKKIDYFLTASSPYAYLGHQRFVDIARRHRATIALKPVDLGKVFAQSGGLPLTKRAPQRLHYRLIELQRWATHLGLPINLHPKFFPVPSDDACKLIIAADLAQGTDAALRLTGDVLAAVWANQRNIADAAELQAIAGEAGLDVRLLATMAEPAQQRYQQYTDEAMQQQVFGAPWFVIDGEPFWGQDRLDFVERALS